MANASEWTEFLASRKWLEEDKLVVPNDAILKLQLSDGRSFTIRGGKPSPQIKIVGEFFTVREGNVDSAGHDRVTCIQVTQVLAIEVLS